MFAMRQKAAAILWGGQDVLGLKRFSVTAPGTPLP